jgi:hypothetical protein
MVSQADSVNNSGVRDQKVSHIGLFAAAFIALVATIGTYLTTGRFIERYDALWVGLFAVSLATLSGAAVNFDPKRLIK